ncbi:MAG: UbiD family decarboxylase [Syntrophorhabdales bacterium]|jgi:4-hydroxy-3-polyprenylbenzoate decarboxylase
MAIHDLRSFIAALEKESELARVRTEVDWNLELAAVVEKNFRQRGPALLFENVKGYKIPFFVGGVQTPRRISIALEIDPETREKDIVREFFERYKTPIKPKIVGSAPCKEQILRESDIDLFRYPAPLWNEHDGGRFIGTWHSVVAKDPDTGWQNVGMHRMMIEERDICGIMFGPFQHIGLIYQKYERLGQPMPVAVAIGNDPVCPIVACSPFGAGVDEWDMAGALRKRPVEVVRCETADLYVPAHSEIVLEGEVPPYERREEGPFGEHTGFYGGARTRKTFVRLKCITQRKDHILRGTLEGTPVVEDHQVTSLSLSAIALKLFEDVGTAGIEAINFPACGDPWLAAIISMRKNYHSHSLDAARILMGSKIGRVLKHIFVVDDDVDVFNLEEVFYAINTRFQAGQDLIVTRDENGSLLDPSVPIDKKGFTDKMILDATWPMTPEFKPREEWGGMSRPPMVTINPKIKNKVEAKWGSYQIRSKPESKPE